MCDRVRFFFCIGDLLLVFDVFIFSITFYIESIILKKVRFENVINSIKK